jgi:hypothetical protein
MKSLNTTCAQNIDRISGKAALRKLGIALHKQNHFVAFDQAVDALLGVAHGEILCGKSCNMGLIISPLRKLGRFGAAQPGQGAGFFR